MCLSVQNKAFDAVILHTQTHLTVGGGGGSESGGEVSAGGGEALARLVGGKVPVGGGGESGEKRGVRSGRKVGLTRGAQATGSASHSPVTRYCTLRATETP